MQLNDMILISVDDHNVEPPEAFIRHYADAHKAEAPRIVKKDGKDVWTFQGKIFPTIGTNAVVGRPRSEYGMEPDEFDQMRPGTYDPRARIDDMNVNGQLAAINFPTMPRFAGNTFFQFPDDHGLRAVRAYNDWHVDEWCAAGPGRFIPMIILPIWDMNATVEELKRWAKRGVHAISFPDNPARCGFPSIHDPYWDPMWNVLDDYRMVINCHIGTGTSAAHASDDSPIDAWITTMPMSIANSAADWLHAPMWKRYPNLKMALSEGGIGWIPYFLERADFTHEHHHEWTFTDFGGRQPSDLFKERIITCFIDDNAGLEMLHHMNPKMVMWECDYPHSDTLWPNCPEYLWKSISKLPKETIDDITHLNVMREYSFDPFSILGRDNCTVGHLRELGKDVDVSPRHHLGGRRTDSMDQTGGARKPVTSGEIVKMLAG
ncbi:amidohydrolase family protein [Sphingobium sp. Sx8-8]|uniref:amidohydrolase family protein n=1 Tax=Sphingobium sp. Sx8-8 TaxID=2933617 RepID=UPI001F5A8F7E|nr:amidohydrolase family protein [Sphingobium sp. Sx8-8]